MTNKTTSAATAAPQKPKATKQEQLLKLLRRDNGASIAELTKATSWLPHTARAMLTGIRKKGFTLEKTKSEAGSRYRITAEPAREQA